MKSTAPILLGAGALALLLLSRSSTAAPAEEASAPDMEELARELDKAADELEAKGDADGAAELREQAAAMRSGEGGWVEGYPDPGDLWDWWESTDYYQEVEERTGALAAWGMDELGDWSTWAQAMGLVLPLAGLAALVLIWRSSSTGSLLDKFKFSVG